MAQQAQIDTGTLSKVMSGKEAFSLKTLNAVTVALELPEGYFYEFFIGECYSSNRDALNPFKLLGLATECVRIGNLMHVVKEVSKHVLELKIDVKKILESIFELAEDA